MTQSRKLIGIKRNPVSIEALYPVKCTHVLFEAKEKQSLRLVSEEEM